MDLQTFLKQRQPEWQRLEQMLQRVQGSGLRGLTDEEAMEFGRLYRRAASDLNQAQTYVSGDEVAGYLNQLLARGYTVVSGGRSRVHLLPLVRSAFTSYAVTLRANLGVLGISTALFMAGTVLGIILSLNDPTFMSYVMPEGFTHIMPGDEEGSDQPRAMTRGEIAAFSGMLFANNVMVSLLAFALGLTFGVGTCWMLFYNGLIMGVIGTLFWRAGQAAQFCADVLPHGVVEIPAILIGGAAGLILARGMLVARPWSRLEELAHAAKRALQLVAGVVPLLALAAVLEAGVARAPSWLLGHWLKLTVAGAVGLMFVLYALYVGRDAGAHGGGSPSRPLNADHLVQHG